MFEKVQQWRERRAMQRQAETAVTAGQGYAGRGWPLTAAATAAEREDLASEIRAWLGRQLTGVATPHGVFTCLAGLCYVQLDGAQRTALDKRSWDIPTRLDAHARFDDAAAHIAATAPPVATTQLEVYLLSMGNLITAQDAADAAGR